MNPKGRLWSLLLVVACLAIGAPSALSADPAGAAPPASPSGSLCTPAMDPASSVPLPVFLSGEDPRDPGPGIECLTGWCSDDSQCEAWFEPGCTCRKQSGASCGQCQCLA